MNSLTLLQGLKSHLLKVPAACTRADYYAIKKLIFSFSIPLPITTIPKGTHFYRYRNHENGEWFFHETANVTYVKDPKKIPFGRSNEEGQAVFYCANNDTTAFIEKTSIPSRKIEPLEDVMTLSVWEAVEDLRVTHVIGNDVTLEKNKEVQALHSKFKHLVVHYDKSDVENYMALMVLLSQQFSAPAYNEAGYYVSCAFSNYALGIVGYDCYFRNCREIDGLVYASSKFPQEGLNFVFNSRVIDSGKITLKNVIRKTLRNVAFKTYSTHQLAFTKGINASSGKIAWY